MYYEVAKHSKYADTWVVEAIDHANEGVIYSAEFGGPHAEERAQEYAEWKNAAVARPQFATAR